MHFLPPVYIVLILPVLKLLDSYFCLRMFVFFSLSESFDFFTYHAAAALQGCVMTLEFWNLCYFLYSFENYLIVNCFDHAILHAACFDFRKVQTLSILPFECLGSFLLTVCYSYFFTSCFQQMKEGLMVESNSHVAYRFSLIWISTKCFQCLTWPVHIFWLGLIFILFCQYLAVFTEPCPTPAAGNCKTLVLLVSNDPWL